MCGEFTVKYCGRILKHDPMGNVSVGVKSQGTFTDWAEQRRCRMKALGNCLPIRLNGVLGVL